MDVSGPVSEKFYFSQRLTIFVTRSSIETFILAMDKVFCEVDFEVSVRATFYSPIIFPMSASPTSTCAMWDLGPGAWTHLNMDFMKSVNLILTRENMFSS